MPGGGSIDPIGVPGGMPGGGNIDPIGVPGGMPGGGNIDPIGVDRADGNNDDVTIGGSADGNNVTVVCFDCGRNVDVTCRVEFGMMDMVSRCAGGGSSVVVVVDARGRIPDGRTDDVIA